MSKKDQHIDNIFKSKVESRTFDSPPSDFLDDLNKRLDEREKSTPSFLWIFFLNLLIIALLIINSVFDFSEIKHSEKITSDQNKIVKSESSEQSEKKKQNKGENEVENEKDEVVNINPDRFNRNPIDDNNKSVSESKNNISSLNEERLTSKSPDVQRKNSNTSKNGVGVGTKDSEQSQSSEKTQNKSTDNSVTAVNERESHEDATSGNNENNSRKEDNNKIEEELIASNYKSIYAADYDNVDDLFKSERIPTISKNKSTLLSDSSLTQESGQNNNSQTDPLKLELQLFGGVSKWGFVTNSSNSDFKSELDSDGKSLWSPTFGINLNTYHKKIAFGTGVSFLTVREENTFEFTDISSYDSTYIAGYNETVTFDTLGNPIDTTYTPYYDSTTVTDTSTTNYNTLNQYSWIQIPINIGYRFQVNKWAIIPRIGINIGIGVNNSDVNYPDETYDQITSAPPLKWNLSLQPSLEIRRDFGNWHIYTRMDYHRNLTPAVEYNWFDRRYQGGMVRLGVGYTFEFERGR